MSSTDRLKQLAALTALNKMFTGNHFNICTVDNVAAMLGIHPEAETRKLLATLHCINYADMPTELAVQLPDLVERCLRDGVVMRELDSAFGVRANAAALRLLK